MKRSRTMGDETQCPASKSGLLYFKVKFFRSLKAQNPVFSETIILHLSVQPDLLRRYGLLQHAVRHIQKSCHRRCGRCREHFLAVSMTFSSGMLPTMTSSFTLGKQRGIHFSTTVLLASAFLNAAAHNLCDGHAGDTKVIEGFVQRLSNWASFTRMETLYMPVAGSAADEFIRSHEGNGCIDLCLAGLAVFIFAQISIFIYIHRLQKDR